MNLFTERDNHLLYQFEVIHARLAIREMFLKTTVIEMYENIGQVLSLVRMQLKFLIPEAREISPHHLHHSGNLIGQSIRDLRHMCRSFYPDIEIEKEGGFTKSLEISIDRIFKGSDYTVSIEGEELKMSQGLALIVFIILQDLLIIINHSGGALKVVHLNFGQQKVIFDLHYKGKMPDLQNVAIGLKSPDHLNLLDRVQLVDGKLQVEKTKAEDIHIQLTTPLKNTSYE
jgi:signal transduction histidine kinase